MLQVVLGTDSEYESSDRFCTGMENVWAACRYMRKAAFRLDWELCSNRGVFGRAQPSWQLKDGGPPRCIYGSVGGPSEVSYATAH